MQPPHYIAPGRRWTVHHHRGVSSTARSKTSVLFAGVTIGEGAVVEDSIVMPGARVEKNARVTRAIIRGEGRGGRGAVLGRLPLGEDGQPAALSSLKNDGIVLVREDAVIKAGGGAAGGHHAGQTEREKLPAGGGEQMITDAMGIIYTGKTPSGSRI